MEQVRVAAGGLAEDRAGEAVSAEAKGKEAEREPVPEVFAYARLADIKRLISPECLAPVLIVRNVIQL
jgi:hypothetical protein